MKVTIKATNAVAEWKWDLPDGHDVDCGICRVDFEGTCSKCKFPGDDCPVIIGECKHCFHLHCINDWIQSDSSQGRCPMCRQVFRQKVATTKPPNNQQPPPSGGSGSHRGHPGGASGGGTITA